MTTGTVLRIAIFTTSFPSSADEAVNAGVCVKDFAEALTSLGHEVEVLTPYKRGARHEFGHENTVFFPWFGASASVSHIDMKSPIGLLQLASVVAMGSVAAVPFVRRFRPDHVLCFWVFPSGLWAKLAAFATGAHYSVWALGSDIWVLGRIPGFSRVLGWLGQGADNRYSDGVVLGQTFEQMAHAKVEFLATSRVLKTPDAPVGEGGYFLYLGRYHPNKGIDLLVEAIGRIKDQLPPDFRVRAHGFGPLEETVRDRVRELGIGHLVEILGPTLASEVGVILRRSRGVIIPSRIESIPLVMSDALQMELPLLVTDVGDMGTLVRKYSAGIVCRPDVDDIARGVLELSRGSVKAPAVELRRLLDIRESARRFIRDIENERSNEHRKPGQ